MVPDNWTFISDPSHGWLRVPIGEISTSGFEPSEFSYLDDKWAYLEEDCDCSGFLESVGFDLTEFGDIPDILVNRFDRKKMRFPHPQESLNL